MTTLSARPFAGDADLELILTLCDACAAADDHDEGMTLNELRSLYDDTWLDPANHVRLWHDADGTMIGYAHMLLPEAETEVDGRLWYRVHPAARELALEDEIIEWAQAELRPLRLQRGVPARLRVSLDQRDNPNIELMEQRGFVVERYYFNMKRPLDNVPEPQFPSGFSVRQVDPEREAEEWVRLKNETWVDHFNYRPWNVERFKSWASDPDEKPELNIVAVAPDGALAAFCWAIIRAEENTQKERNEGVIDLVGTHPAYRRQGLGRAMLLETLHRLKAAGMDTAALDVDAASPTGATRLYEAAGFRVYSTFVGYVKDVE